MDQNPMHEFDAIIEKALAEEPMQALPEGFHNRLCKRLEVAAVVRKEQQRAGFGIITGAVLFVALAFTLVVAPSLAYIQGWVSRSVPGAMGYIDYMTVSMVRGVAEMNRPILLVAACTGCLAVAVIAFSLVRLKANLSRH